MLLYTSQFMCHSKDSTGNMRKWERGKHAQFKTVPRPCGKWPMYPLHQHTHSLSLKLSGLRLAECPALGISGSLMPCSQGVGCQQPVVWCGWKCWFIATAAAQSMCLHVRGPEKVNNLELFVHGQGEARCFLIGYSNSCWMVTVLILFSSLDYGLICICRTPGSGFSLDSR